MKPLTEQRLADAMGISSEASAMWLPHVQTALTLCKCDTPETVAMWIAQVGHESAGLTRLVESLNYTPDGLMKTWPARYTLGRATADGRMGSEPADQRAIANHVYGDRLGNRPGTDDGWTYRGRGPIQVTGRANYRECGAAIGIDLERDPSALELRSTGAASTAWYWNKHRLTQYGGDVEKVTRAINGGTNGLAERKARYAKAISVLAG